MESKAKKPKMMQLNVMDMGGGKLTINVKRHGFSDPEVLGVLELAKAQVMGRVKSRVEHSSRFGFRKKDDDKKSQ